MPYPDVLPPEIWYHIVSIGNVDRSDLTSWLRVAPQTYAKGMHDAAFAERFGRVYIRGFSKDDWLEAALHLSQYAREEKLYTAVRNVMGSWNAEPFWNKKQSPEEMHKQLKLMRMLEDLICDVLEKFQGVRDLDWSNCFRASPIKPKIFRCLERYFPTLTSLTLAGIYFDTPLDLRSATCLSRLHLSCVRLTSSTASPPILLNEKLKDLSFNKVYAQEEFSLSEDEMPDGTIVPHLDFDVPPPHILSSLDLSEITRLFFGSINLSKLDVSHMLPEAHSPMSMGDSLEHLFLCSIDPELLSTLSKCRTFPKLEQCRIQMIPQDVLDVRCAEEAIKNVSSFIGRQKALKHLSLGFSDMHNIPADEIADEDTRAYEQALAQAFFRDAFAGLKNLLRLSIATYCFGSQFPALGAEFASAVPSLETLIVQCVVTTIMTDDAFDAMALAFNRYPNLQFVGFQTRYPKEDDPAFKRMLESFPKALQRHAPRVKYCGMGRGNLFRLHGTTGIERVILFDPDFHQVHRNLNMLF